ncbi:MAG: hypothetical protein K8S15_03410 [Candidatus Aegiribacteria sp.]|nr:hypothetical protein [Candidatus Aegiribacteria sp.]
MRRVFLLICVLAFAGTAFAGFSIGFKQTFVPTSVGSSGSVSTEDMYLLRIGAMASPDFRIEGYLGYMKSSFELDPAVAASKYDGSSMMFGAGGYYVIEAPANTSFSFGAQFLYGKSSYEVGGVDGPETTCWSLDPLMRIDFAIPGAERLAFFTEYGIRYGKATTTVVEESVSVDYKWSGWQTYAPTNILAGAYFVF